jgi:arylsulfatase A
MTAYMDKLVGSVVSELEKQGLRENTLILFTGDNGTGTAVTSRMGDRTVKGGKGSSRDNGIHVPLIANWPGRIAAATVCQDLVDTTDYLPTICEAAGIAVPGDVVLDGRSFLPQLLGQPGQPRKWNYCWYAREGGAQATFEFAFNQKFKLYRDGRLYAWPQDLHEDAPLAADQEPEVRKLLQSALDRYSAPRDPALVNQAGKGKGKGKEE